MSLNYLRGAAGFALVVAAVVGAGAIVQAQQDESQDQGRVVQIGKDDVDQSGETDRLLNRGPQPTDGAIVDAPQAPKFWIGLLGGLIQEDHPLRAHVDLPTGEALLVADVVPNSPASKAGLKKNDILLRANDTPLKAMTDLQELVATEGEKDGQIALEVFRRGERETIYVTPEERPADAQVSTGGFGEGGFGEGGGFPMDVEEMMRQLQRGQRPFNFRNFGPGVIVGRPGMLNVPNGQVSVSINKQQGQPTEITVKRGEETWKVVGDDPESLEKLPDDLRPFVERMLRGDTRMNFENFELANPQMPNLERLERRFGDDRISERLEEMERRMEELQRRLLGPDDENGDQQSEEAEPAEEAEAN
jgi:membrane-associated protease RseP (regulator of RpoE activity)